MTNQKDTIGNILVFTLLILLTVAGIISYKSIDWTVLKRMEDSKLVLPTPIPTNVATQSTQIAPTATPSTDIKK